MMPLAWYSAILVRHLRQSTSSDWGECVIYKQSTRRLKLFLEPDRALAQSSDVWSLVVVIWEILGIKAIFSEYEPEAEVIAEQIDVLGAQCLPDHWRATWDSQNDLISRSDASGELRAEREIWPTLQDAFENFIQAYRRGRKAAGALGE
jgi:serine/threonine-protein kinase SRPK3